MRGGSVKPVSLRAEREDERLCHIRPLRQGRLKSGMEPLECNLSSGRSKTDGGVRDGSVRAGLLVVCLSFTEGVLRTCCLGLGTYRELPGRLLQ